MSHSAEKTANSLVLPYLFLRRVVGGLGVLLPVFVVVGALWVGPDTALRHSISAYYHSVARDLFVGFLFAIAVFLYAYKGYEKEEGAPRFELSDDLAGNLACVFALGVALFPTAGSSEVASTLHLISAGLLFLTLAYFSMKLFTKTGDEGNQTQEKLKRNRVYVTCGIVMLACIGAILIYSIWLEATVVADLKPVFWLETLALWAFGVSWFVKGETLWKDD